MVSLELAKRLKELGLEWEPQEGDWYYFGESKEPDLNINPRPGQETPKGIWFAPRLDQLLAEIERRGYWWSIENGLAEYLCFFVKQDGKKFIKQSFWANSPEEATAQALIWILEQKQATE